MPVLSARLRTRATAGANTFGHRTTNEELKDGSAENPFRPANLSYHPWPISGIDNYGVGLGDLLVYSLFMVAAYKAYGVKAARIAFGVIMVFGAFVTAFIPLTLNFLDQELDLLVPSQALFGPAAFLCYLWFKRRYGPERTMAEYRERSSPPR